MKRYKATVERLKSILEARPDWVATSENLDKYPGVSEHDLYLENMSKKDMLKLERLGLAVRGKTDNGGLKVYETKDKNYVWKREFGSGFRNMWVLFMPKEEENVEPKESV